MNWRKRSKIKIKHFQPDQEKRKNKMPRKNSNSAKAGKTNKYGNKKTYYDGYKFDSIRECNRYKELKQMEEEGVIIDLVLQKRYDLHTAVFDADGKLVGSQRDGWYIADFVYKTNGFDDTIVEDCKGYRTPEYKRKKKRMKIQYGITILET